MSLSDGLKRAPIRAERLRVLRNNAAWFVMLLARKSRPAFRRAAAVRIGGNVLTLVALIAFTMIVVDAVAIDAAKRLPEWVPAFFDRITHFGKAQWFLIPIAILLAVIAALASPALPEFSRRVLAAIAVRLGFLFWAIALPGLVFTIAKRLIGRARPLVNGSVDPFLYLPLGWRVEYASFPSGHATDAFAAAAAIGALWPRARPVMLIYALMIAASRVVLTAHFPSDVLAGAIVGVVGVLLVRAWFASRALAFAQGADERLRAMPGPSFARIKRVARQLVAP
jgi:membrane-associated phospholipid phosphatase